YALGGSGDRQKPEKNPEKKTEENPERAEPSVCAAPEDKTKKTAQTWAGSVRCPVDAGSADGAPPSTRADLLCPLRGQPATDRLGPPYDTIATCCSGPFWVWRSRSISAQTVKPSSGLPWIPIAKASMDTVSTP